LERQDEDKIDPQIITQIFKYWKSNDFKYNYLIINYLYLCFFELVKAKRNIESVGKNLKSYSFSQPFIGIKIIYPSKSNYPYFVPEIPFCLSITAEK